ncbi:LysR family transcriptional regulator [Vibrio sp. SM6]|uniref:LysR family transcriptional regulator n=1 Tax=Vibrio agarilyticus TaxID=2726741 RepID=A0A7X8YHV9_9VIBR|nr:LysR family transcriptional regulator [Vibrio agarilyticus]NLS14513.1 LysR family transcriptional regulator [Vibrio agarilyticus]
MYSIEQLKIFVEVCQSGSFSAAARRLNRAQSGVSQAIANLEIAIDQTLFSREKNRPQLTESGQALLPIAQAILQQAHYFDQKIEALRQDAEHELVIAVDESLPTSEFLREIGALSTRFPTTNIEVLSVSTFDIPTLIRQGRAQIGIVYATGELLPDMDFYLLGQTRFLTIAAPEHPLAQLATVRDNDLKRYRQCVHRSLDKEELWFTYGISTELWYANRHETLVEWVKQKVGWANVPESLVRAALVDGSLVALPVSHEKSGWLTSVGCVVSRRHHPGPALSAVLGCVQAHLFTLT